MQTRLQRLLCSFAVLAALALSAKSFADESGGSIGLNFGANEPDASLTAETVAGAVPQANWNNLSGPIGSASALVADDSGSARSTQAQATWMSRNTWVTQPPRFGDSNNQFPVGGDRTMMTGYLDTNDQESGRATVTVSGLGPEFTDNGYDVIVYCVGGAAALRGGAYILGDTTKFGTTIVNPTTHVEDPGADHVDQGTYVRFTGLKLPSFTLTANAGPGLGAGNPRRAPINGIQIVAGRPLATDTDNDGMPDDWETKYGLNPNDPSDAAKDCNNNGVANLQEFQLGLGPCDTTKPTLLSATTTPSFDTVRLTFSEELVPSTATNSANYTISPSLAVTALSYKAKVVTLTTAQQTPGATAYTVTVKGVTDLSKNEIAADTKATFYSYLMATQGVLKFSYWGDATGGEQITGTAVDGLLGDPRYPASPDLVLGVFSFNSRDAFPDDSHEQYGATIEGYLTPTEPGDYRFFIYSDDASQLFLSTDDKDANLVQIAEETGCCNNFTEPDSPRTSEPIALVAGRKYFIRLIFKEGGGGDYGQVAWRKEGDTTAAGLLRPIPGKFLSSATPLPMPAEGGFVTQTPAPNAPRVSPATAVTIAHRDGKTEWTAANTSLKLDGVSVTPTFTKDANVATLIYKPSGLLPSKSSHTITLGYMDPGGNPATTEWSFNVAEYKGPIKDSVAGINAIIVGAAKQTDDQGGFSGKAGDRALDFGSTSSGQYAQIPDASFMNAAAAGDQLTFTLWVKRYDIANSSAFWADSPSSSGSQRGFQAHTPWSNNSVYFDTAGCCDGATQRISAGIDTFPGYSGDETWWESWHHFAFVKDAGHKQIWIDGQLFLEGDNSNKLPTDFERIWLAAEGGSTMANNYNMHGLEDDFAIFGSALQPADITKLAGGASPASLGAAAKPIAYWDFNTVSDPLSADLEVTITSDNPRPSVGASITYTISVKNHGPAPALNTTASFHLQGMEIESILLPDGVVCEAGLPLEQICSLGTLNPGDPPVTIRIKAHGVEQTTEDLILALEATVKSDTRDEFPVNNRKALRLRVEPILTTPQSNKNWPFSGSALEPIATFTGELYENLPPDLSLGGPMPLYFQRYYASLLKKDGLIAGRLGHNWLHNFEMALTATPSNTVNIVTSQGRLIEFTNTAGAFVLVGRTEIPFQLAASGGDYILADPRTQRLFTFDATRKLAKIADGRGNSHSLVYTGDLLTSVADGLGRTLAFEYSAANLLTNVSDGSRSVGFTHGGNLLTSVRNARGHTTLYEYDTNSVENAWLTATVLPESNIALAQTWNTNGQVTAQTSGGTDVTSITYSNDTTIVTNAQGHTQRHVHSSNGELLSHTDESNRSITMSYADGRRTAVTDRLGYTTSIGYHGPSGLVSASTNADGTVTALSFAPRAVGNLTLYDLGRVTFADGSSQSYGYDPQGNPTTLTDRTGRQWSFAYNGRGQVLSVTNPLGGMFTYTYHPDGTLASRRDLETDPTRYEYDALRRLTNIVHPDSTSTGLGYDANNRLTSLRDARSFTTRVAYDGNNRLTQVIDAAGQTTHFTYDAQDRLVSAADRLGGRTGRAYDALSHLSATTNRNGHISRFEYDPRQRLTALIDPGGQAWRSEYDDEHRLTAFANPLGQTNRIALNTLGVSVGVTDPLGGTVRLGRDALQRITNLVDQVSRTNQFSYDNAGRLSHAAQPLIGSAQYERNELGQLSRIVGLNGEQWQFRYSSMGRLAEFIDPLGRITRRAYDPQGRLQSIAFADGSTMTRSYNASGNIVRRQFSNGPDYRYAYDSLNRRVAIDADEIAYDWEGRVTNTLSGGVRFSSQHDAGGRLTQLGYFDGLFRVQYEYDSRDRLTAVTDSFAGARVELVYDDAGRLIRLNRANGVNGTYSYDAAGRLFRIQEGAIIDLQYTLNAAGDIDSVEYTAPLDPANGLSERASTLEYDAAHRVKSSGYAYDLRGRRVQAPDATFRWNAASRLVGINQVTLDYNGLGSLTRRTEAGVTTHFHYSHALSPRLILAESNEAAAQPGRFYVWTPGGQLLYLIDAANANAVSYYHFDRVGSTVALTSADGAVSDSYAYAPAGQLLAHHGGSTQPFAFVGQRGVRLESGPNLYQMGARYYDAHTQSFLSADPLWPRLQEVKSINPYEYALRNPMRYIDPAGLEETAKQFTEHLVSDMSKDMAQARDPLGGTDRGVSEAYVNWLMRRNPLPVVTPPQTFDVVTQGGSPWTDSTDVTRSDVVVLQDGVNAVPGDLPWKDLFFSGDSEPFYNEDGDLIDEIM
ncbi:MAG: DUF6531 domain-containing protein [Verrucomicrobiales bacterium]|nr:DUF6531 domain-containing protein [Verrucomicrobiales bacterium]